MSKDRADPFAPARLLIGTVVDTGDLDQIVEFVAPDAVDEMSRHILGVRSTYPDLQRNTREGFLLRVRQWLASLVNTHSSSPRFGAMEYARGRVTVRRPLRCACRRSSRGRYCIAFQCRIRARGPGRIPKPFARAAVAALGIALVHSRYWGSAARQPLSHSEWTKLLRQDCTRACDPAALTTTEIRRLVEVSVVMTWWACKIARCT